MAIRFTAKNILKYGLIIVAAFFVALFLVEACCEIACPMTAQITWDIGDEPDLFGYTFLYNVNGGPWLPHRGGIVIPLDEMTQREGRTGRNFTAPDTGSVYRVQPLAVDTSGNISLCGRIVVIDTFHQTTPLEDCP